MNDYAPYLENLEGMALFDRMASTEILDLLDAMQPPIKEGFLSPPADGGPHRAFRLVVATEPSVKARPRIFAYDLPGHGEPGMLMGEVLVLSRKEEFIKPTPLHVKRDLPEISWSIITLEFTAEMITQPLGCDVSAAQGKMLRNLLGILAQKITDVRRELYLERGGYDIYAQENWVKDGAGSGSN